MKKFQFFPFHLTIASRLAGLFSGEKQNDRKIRKDILAELKIPVEEIKNLKRGQDYIDEKGDIHKNEDITSDPPSPRSYAYCSDTAYNEKIIPYIQGCDLLYHEATFMQVMAVIAKEKQHSTTIEAATLAKKADVKKLLIGHFSARYEDLQPLLEEAKTVFPATIIAEDGLSINI